MTEFWLISAPGSKTPQQTWEACKAKTEGLSVNYKFNLPELKVSGDIISILYNIHRVVRTIAPQIISYLARWGQNTVCACNVHNI